MGKWKETPRLERGKRESKCGKENNIWPLPQIILDPPLDYSLHHLLQCFYVNKLRRHTDNELPHRTQRRGSRLASADQPQRFISSESVTVKHCWWFSHGHVFVGKQRNKNCPHAWASINDMGGTLTPYNLVWGPQQLCPLTFWTARLFNLINYRLPLLWYTQRFTLLDFIDRMHEIRTIAMDDPGQKRLSVCPSLCKQS